MAGLTRVVLYNDYHGASVVLMAERGALGEYLTQEQMARAREALCGVEGCRCGANVLGMRGGGNRYVVSSVGRGGCLLVRKN